MNHVGQPERLTQNRVVQLFKNALKYDYLGNREDRPDNRNIEEDLLTKYLTEKEYSPAYITFTNASHMLFYIRINSDYNLIIRYSDE